MSAIELPATAPPPPAGRIGRRLPSSRGGMAWLAVLVIVGALLAVQFGRQVYANWEMGQRADELAAQIAAYEAENTELQAELDYLESDAYVGAEARRLSNVGARGEEALIIPPGAEAPIPNDLVVTEPRQSLLEQWVRLFFGPGD
ncbi:MAG TPA: septum formation initiator family protein [Candidatus Limnocylindria bacterium]